MAKIVSKTYGEALFQLAIDQNKLDQYMEEMIMIQGILKENPEFATLMIHPRIMKEEKQDVIVQVFDKRVDKEIVGFFDIVITKDRYYDIDAIISYFVEKAKLEKGIGTVKVVSATTLDEKQKESIYDRLLNTTEFTALEMTYIVDEDLIGGLVIRIGDRVVDSSIKTKLEELQKELMKIQLTK